MPFPLYLLAMAIFVMGTSEFMLAGLLPDIASDLDVTVGTAGALTSAFAVGMVVGAPLMAWLARNRPGRTSLLGCVLVFSVAHAAGAVTTSFAVMFAARVIAALANAGFLAVALTTAAELVPPGRKGRALAVLLSGTTLATVAGVPGGSVLGTLLGWRAAFWAVAALCLPAAIGILEGIPAPAVAGEPAGGPAEGPTGGPAGGPAEGPAGGPAGGPVEGPAGGPAGEPAGELPEGPAGEPAGELPEGPAEGSAGGPAMRAELAQLRGPRLVLVMVLGALVNAATFGSFTFLAPVVTGTARLGDLWVAVVLVLFGAGSYVGVTVAGRLSDQRPGVVVTAAGPLLLLGWPALAVLADEPAGLLILVFVQGALSFALGSTLITRILHEAAGAPTMAGSYATAALNFGAAVGPLIAASSLSTAAGDLGPFWASGALVLVALLVALPLRGVIAAERSPRAPAGTAPRW